MEANGAPLPFQNPIRDAISRVRFAPQSDNLLISSWDSCLRLYDVGSSELRLEAPSKAPLLDCCFQDESLAFISGSDGFIRRYDLHSGTSEVIGNHADLSTCIGYSDATCQVIITGLHKKILSWDTRMEKDLLCLVNLGSEVDSMSISGFDIMLAVGTSVYMYDLRNLSRSVQSKKSDMDLRIKCVSSVPYSKGFAAGSVDGRVALEMSFSANSDDITSNFSYTFRCHPKSANKRLHLVSVNDIVFNPLIGSAFFTGDNNGYVSAWNAQSRKRLFELPRYPNSVASLSMNHKGQLLAVASSYTYQEANEIIRSVSSGSSSSH
ncbi:mitotic checkpoint protein BUB3.3 isoform X2 [Morus notabilis]|uniref:mitotic checkpoint protein BUB3.3 isoform X2 n=1 Tax=Morus notabilis TaxID=981085 RepID=UPI000CECFD70|nr:mitotic checkpoint protein BUB3.3 isoform X2 [Morus notabilis]XP_024028550.1 mitotic checkpoint protein BUB3.3 isoform X2 [Morus notabilis]